MVATINKAQAPPPPRTLAPPANETKAIYDITIRFLTACWNNTPTEQRRPWYIHWIEHAVWEKIQDLNKLGLWPFEKTPGEDTIQRRIREMQDENIDWSEAVNGVPPLMTFGRGYYIFHPLRFDGTYREEILALAGEGRALLEQKVSKLEANRKTRPVQ